MIQFFTRMPEQQLNSPVFPDYIDFLIKRFERPDEVRVFKKGRFELIKIGGMTIGRATYEPGWRWSQHVAPVAGTALCHVEHVGMVISGQAACAMEDGRSYVMKPGDIFYIGPGHDSWVVGDEPYVSFHFLGAEKYAHE
jgi:quercetin dioxygenase-like cupin family protein